VADILKGVVGKSAFLIPWMFASALGLGAAAWLLLPTQIQLGLAGPIGSLDNTTRGVVLTASVVLFGFTLGAASTPLYRVLEGYVGPKALRAWGARSQRNAKWRLKSRVRRLSNQTDPDAAILYEALARFPEDDNQILPTRLGNAIRAFETYGHARFRLDSQGLWFELIAVCPGKLQDELDNSRAATDFFVGVVYISLLYALAAAALAVAKLNQPHGQADFSLIAQTVVAITIVPVVAYRLAVSSTTYWATTVRAMVNVGRLRLAEVMGLEMPDTVEEEQTMWGALTGFVFGEDTEYWKNELNKYRTRKRDVGSEKVDESTALRGQSSDDGGDGSDDADSDS